MKNKILNTVAGIILGALVLLLNPVDAIAQYYSQGQVTKSISVDKKVRAISDTKYFDNIDKSVYSFYNNDLIEFKIDVENNGPNELTNIKVRDILPNNLELVLFPGTKNSSDNSIEWKIDKLASTEVKSFMVRAKIINSVSQCGKVTNIAQVSTDNIGDQDSASYYVGCNTIPDTGDPSLLFNTLFGFGTVLGALGVRKYVRGY